MATGPKINVSHLLVKMRFLTALGSNNEIDVL